MTVPDAFHYHVVNLEIEWAPRSDHARAFVPQHLAFVKSDLDVAGPVQIRALPVSAGRASSGARRDAAVEIVEASEVFFLGPRTELHRLTWVGG